jgi:short-subunit dehydrogenase
LINAAGYGKFGRFDELSDDDIAGMIDLNSRALVLMTHATVPYMEQGGRIIELGSGSCFTPLPNFNVYAASKSFVLHYTKALNYELKRYNVRATCFCPGWVDTDFFGVAEGVGVSGPAKKHIKPLLNAKKITRGCLKAAKRGKAMYVTGWYTKLQHVLFKLLPDPILTKIWMRMQRSPDKEG